MLTRRSPAVAIAVTAGAAVLLAPLGRRLQRRVDARLYPARHAAFEAIADLHRETLLAQAGPEQLQQRLRDALGGPHPRRRVLPAGERIHRRRRRGRPARCPNRRSTSRSDPQRIGVLSTRAPIAGELVRAIAARAAPLVELVRLRLELRQALTEAEDSRARLLRVGYEERIRLERDLHDGAQQRLVALGMALRLAQRRLGRGVDVTAVFDEAVAELGTAVSELRQLAHGIRPSCLDDGLVPALSQLVSTTHLPIVLHVTATDLDQDVETTAYYVAAEAITNAVKHAEATTITLDVDVVDGQLRVRVADDGNGRASCPSGVGTRRPRRPGRRARRPAVDREPDAAPAPSSRRCCRAHRDRRGLHPVPRRTRQPAHRRRARRSWPGYPTPPACWTPYETSAPTSRSSTSGCHRTTPTTARAPPCSCEPRIPELGILLLSQHIETTHSVHLVSTGAFGYLLKDRVLDVDDFLDALQRVASGGSALDPEVVSRLISMNSAHEPLHTLTPRERDVLALMAQGHTNAGIARRLFLSERTVETHIASLLAKLGIEPATHGHRRVLAVLAFLNAQT